MVFMRARRWLKKKRAYTVCRHATACAAVLRIVYYDNECYTDQG